MFGIQASARLSAISRVAGILRGVRSIVVSERPKQLQCFPIVPALIHHNFPVFHNPQIRLFHHSSVVRAEKPDDDSKEKVSITFVDKDNNKYPVTGYEGQDILQLAHDNNIDIEGACEGTCCCSTCHIILSQEVFDKLEEPQDEELDMLDLALDVTDTSRLGCQVLLTKEIDGSVFQLPDEVQNFYD